VIEIKAESKGGYRDIKTVGVKWKKYKALEDESRLRIAVSDFIDTEGKFEDDLVAFMREDKRFFDPVHFRLEKNEQLDEKMMRDRAKAGEFHCVLFGKIIRYADYVHINVWLKDSEDRGSIVENVNVFAPRIPNSPNELRELSKALNYKLVDDLPLLTGSVIDGPAGKRITVDIGEETKVKKGMRLLVYQPEKEESSDDEITIREDGLLGEAKISKVQKKDSFANLIGGGKKVQPQQYVITR
jgi:hypothetical protein